MTSLIILAALAGFILVLLMTEPAPALASADGAPLPDESEGEAPKKKGFVLPGWARTILLFIASAGAGLIIAGYVGPWVVLGAFALVAFAFYYRTDKGRENVNKQAARLRTAAAQAATSAKAGVQKTAQTIASAAADKPAGAAPAAAAPITIEAALDQLVSATRVARAARSAPAETSRATIEQARKVAGSAIERLVERLSADGDAARAAVEAYAQKESVTADEGLSALLAHVLMTHEMARFDQAGYRTLLLDMWDRSNAGAGV